MKPDISGRKPKRRNCVTYAAGAGFLVYQDGRRLDLDWAERMRAYHVGQIATPGISAERLANNQRLARRDRCRDGDQLSRYQEGFGSMSLHLIPRRRSRDFLGALRLFASAALLIGLIVGAYAFLGFN